MANRIPVLLSLLAAVCMHGCASVGTRFSAPRMTNAMDAAVNAVSRQQADELILVTMVNSLHDELRQGQSIGMIKTKGINPSNDVLAGPYGEFIADIGQNYGLERVADWPLRSLGIRCLVFRS
ncbi:MAG: hypothetical protein ACR2RB_17400, partial [Gammaproteobacteria bacterium]